jgi:hypothetical protein
MPVPVRQSDGLVRGELGPAYPRRSPLRVLTVLSPHITLNR